MNDVALYAIALRLVSLRDTLFSQDDVFLDVQPHGDRVRSRRKYPLVDKDATSLERY